MILVSREIFRILFVTLLCSSCTIFTLATDELDNLEEIINSNSTLDRIKNETLSEGPKSPPIVPALVEVIHGNVNSVVHEIHGSIDDIPLLIKTDIQPEDNLSTESHINISVTPSKEAALPVDNRLVEEAVNLTAPEAPTTELQQNATASGPQDDIPSFSEWAKKHMAETHGRTKGENLTVGSVGTKLRFKNYASPDCGAKVLAANPEATSPSAILSATRDDYMLNPCNVKIWFIVELCEPIQPQRIELANFELFSSSPQELSVYTSDRFPSRDWAQTGALMARDERTIQSFSLPRVSHFVKYIKIELHSHYGSEHFCPISLFRAYGTSEIEVLETVDGEETETDEGDEPLGEKRDLLEELEVAKEKELEPSPEGEKPNLFGSAKAAVMSIVKKAAEVLVKSPGNQSSACGQSGNFEYRQCFTPGYEIVCTNCSENFYSKLYERLCCHGSELQCLLSNEFVHSVISETQLCSEIGLSWNVSSHSNFSFHSNFTTYSPKAEYLKAFLPREMIAALCNYQAVTKKRVDLNTTHEEPIKEEVKIPENNDTINDEPKVETNIEPEVDVIIPTKVVEEEQLTLTLESSLEEVTTVVETKTANIDSPTNATETLVPTALPVVNETSGKAKEEENHVTQPVVEPKTKQADNDEPAVVDISLDALFDTEEEQLGKAKQEDIIEQEEAKASATVTVQKESVLVRLANRIKALEVNMSLSSQYLEELSRRYKRQVEELQRNLNSVLEERRLAAERENAQAVQLAVLTSKVETLTSTIGELIAERDSWSNKALVFGQHGMIVTLEVIGFIIVVWVWRRLGPNGSQKSEIQRAPHIARRHSAEEPYPRNSVRRPSEEANLSSGGTHQELLTEAPKRKVSREGVRKRKRRRKGGEVIVIGGPEEDWQPLQAPPDFIKTALWQRGKRSSQTQTSSSQEQLSISSDHSATKPKKTGAFRRIVKKLF